MIKLIRGIVDFRKNKRPLYKEIFAKLALGQSPDALLIACSDSRVVPNLFASSDPGDLFVVRNVGNLIPPYQLPEHTSPCLHPSSEAAAIEFALTALPIKDIIVCGHSECGAMIALEKNNLPSQVALLKQWLSYGENILTSQNKCLSFIDTPYLKQHNQLSQLNVLQQIEHLKTYPMVAQKLSEKKLHLHGWWFDIKEADIYEYEQGKKKFCLIDEEYAQTLINRALT